MIFANGYFCKDRTLLANNLIFLKQKVSEMKHLTNLGS